jgi:hypothetical protein
VIGLPEGSPAEGQLMVHLNDHAELAGASTCHTNSTTSRRRLALVATVVPPESLIGNTHEEIEELGDGWMRVQLTFDVTPPPAWQELHMVPVRKRKGRPRRD